MSRALLFSLLLPLLALAQDSGSGSELPPAGYNGGSDNPQDSDDAGAAGSSKGAFELSSGGLVAIIVVAVIVVIGGSRFNLVWSWAIVYLSSFSRLSDALVASKEASMGRSTVHSSCFPPHYWSLNSRCQQTKPPEPTHRYSSQLTAAGQELKAQARTRPRKGTSSIE